MAFLSVIRRWYFRQQLSIREISRRTGLSRNTIRKYLRNGTVERARARIITWHRYSTNVSRPGQDAAHQHCASNA